MSAVPPPVRWGSRQVTLAWGPESADEMVATARPLLAEMTGALAFTFIAGAAIIVNSISNGGLGFLGIAVATALAYGIIVSAFYSVSGGHLNPAVTLAHLAARRIPVFVAILYVGVQLVGAVLGVLFGMLVAFPLTGGAMNLARVFGTDFVAGEWADFGSYAIGLIGGLAAGLGYQVFFIFPKETQGGNGPFQGV